MSSPATMTQKPALRYVKDCKTKSEDDTSALLTIQMVLRGGTIVLVDRDETGVRGKPIRRSYDAFPNSSSSVFTHVYRSVRQDCASFRLTEHT